VPITGRESTISVSLPHGLITPVIKPGTRQISSKKVGQYKYLHSRANAIIQHVLDQYQLISLTEIGTRRLISNWEDEIQWSTRRLHAYIDKAGPPAGETDTTTAKQKLKKSLRDVGEVYGLESLLDNLKTEFAKFDDASSTSASKNECSKEQIDESILDDEDSELAEPSQPRGDETSSHALESIERESDYFPEVESDFGDEDEIEEDEDEVDIYEDEGEGTEAEGDEDDDEEHVLTLLQAKQHVPLRVSPRRNSQSPVQARRRSERLRSLTPS
jgi:hypothetical protein